MLVKEWTNRSKEQNREPRKRHINRIHWSLRKKQKQYNGVKPVTSTNGIGATKYPHVMKWIYALILCPSPKLTQNESQTKAKPNAIKLLEDKIGEI